MWTEITKDRYDYALNVLPPAIWFGYGFLVGEPTDHAECTVTGQLRARYPAYIRKNGRYYESRRQTRSR